jgi:acyl dehydratase
MNERKKQTFTIDKYLPIYYAGASGDFNLIHIDPEFARKQGLKANILQGLCTLGIATGFLVGQDDPDKLKSIKVRFANPVLPGDKLTFAIENTDAEEEFSAVNQRDDEVLSDCSAELS